MPCFKDVHHSERIRNKESAHGTDDQESRRSGVGLGDVGDCRGRSLEHLGVGELNAILRTVDAFLEDHGLIMFLV